MPAPRSSWGSDVRFGAPDAREYFCGSCVALSAVVKTGVQRASGIVERTETMRTLTPCSRESSLHLLVR